MGETIDARIAFLQRQLHAISLAAHQAKAREDTAALANLRELWNKVAADVAALQDEARENDSPAALLVALDNFGDQVIAVGKDIGAAAVDTVQGAAAIIKYLPLILAVTLIVVGLVYAGKIRKDLK